MQARRKRKWQTKAYLKKACKSLQKYKSLALLPAYTHTTYIHSIQMQSDVADSCCMGVICQRRCKCQRSMGNYDEGCAHTHTCILKCCTSRLKAVLKAIYSFNLMYWNQRANQLKGTQWSNKNKSLHDRFLIKYCCFKKYCKKRHEGILVGILVYVISI